MNPQIRALMRLLEAAHFEFPVAFFEDVDPEIGDMIDADAFDVPSLGRRDISLRLGEILWSQSFHPRTVLTGTVEARDSEERRECLPPDTVWYLPTKAALRTRVPSS